MVTILDNIAGRTEVGGAGPVVLDATIRGGILRTERRLVTDFSSRSQARFCGISSI
jgi:hypothetical protein